MKKYNFKILLFIFTLLLLFPSYVMAEDVTSNFTITSARACSDTSCSTVYDENNGFTCMGRDKFLVEMNWSYSSDEAIENGDTILIPFANEVYTVSTSRWEGGTFSWTNITDNRGNKIGQWRISGSYENRKLEIKFSDYAVGKNSLNGVLYSPKSLYSRFNYEDKVIPLTVGNITLNVLSKTTELKIANSSPWCTTINVSSNRVGWSNISPGKTIKELYLYDDYDELTDDAIYDNLIFESIVPEGGNFRTSLAANSRVVLPNNIAEHKASGAGISVGDISLFSKVNQLENETYDEFKNRLNEMEYGVYEDSETNSQIIVMNFGSQPSKSINNDAIVKEINSNWGISQYLIDKNPYTVNQEVGDIIERAVGPNNIVQGMVSYWNNEYYIHYPMASVQNVVVNNNTKWSYTDTDGNLKVIDANCSATLVLPSSAAVVNGEAKLYLVDSGSRMPIEGATLKLQKQNGTNWDDIASNLVTDDTGMVSVSSLEDGEYRFVQTGYLEHYITDSFKAYNNNSLSSLITSFQLNGDGANIYATNEREKFTIVYKPGEHGNFEDQTYNVYYGDALPTYNATSDDGWNFVGWSPAPKMVVTDNATYTAEWEKEVNLTVHYYISGTTTKVSDDVITIVKVGDTYTTSEPSEIDNKYEFVGTSGEISGTVGESDIEVIYYYQLKSARLIVNYIDEETDEVLSTKVEQNLHYGDTYTTSEPDDIARNYVLKRVEGEVSGTINSDVVEVTYYYEKKDSKINVSLDKTGPDEITSKNDTLSYKIEYEVNLEDYIGNATITIIDTLPYKLTDDSDLDGGTYNSSDNTITWTEQWDNIDSYTSGTKQITKNIRIKYSNLDSSERVITNNVKGTIELDNNSKEVISNCNTLVKIPSKITVKYIDIETNNELFDTIEENSLVGDDYSLDTKEIEGYNLVEGPDTEVIKFTEDDQEIIYKYKKQIFNISTGILGNGGTITGDEPIKYGEDSTKNKIKITADDNYYIGKVLVNGKELKIKSNLKTLTLDNFKEVKENKEIVVIFNKILENPKTGNNFIYYLIGGLLIISIGVSIFIIRKRHMKEAK